MIAVSIKVIINVSRLKKDGTAALYLRVIINRESIKIPLKISWPPLKWDSKKQLCKPRSLDDKAANDNNLLIRDAIAKANEILITYRLQRLSVSREQFLKDYSSNFSKEDFLAFYRYRMIERLKSGEITLETKKAHEVTYNHLKNWKRQILFSDLDEKTAARFDKYLLDKTGSQKLNARWGQHKNFKTYLNEAKREKISFTHPYDYFSAKQEESRFVPLHQHEFLKLYKEYQSPNCQGTYRNVLRAFLFCCVTGMRHSDVRRVMLDWIDGEFFEFTPYKTRRFGTKVRVPVTKESLDMVADEIDEVGMEPLFRSITEQKQNKIISDIGQFLEIRTKLCFQIARETFATLYMEKDGKLEVLASFLGHTTTAMSEKYVKIRDARKKEEAVRISSFFR
jgi:integrase/recombinase XerD